MHYDYARPVRTIRELGELGLIGAFDSALDGYVIDAWTPGGGTQTILAKDFLTYQTPGSDPSPPFAEYTSGHSAFSSAGAEILRLFTESDSFGASISFETGESRFEPSITPAASVTLSWIRIQLRQTKVVSLDFTVAYTLTTAMLTVVRSVWKLLNPFGRPR